MAVARRSRLHAVLVGKRLGCQFVSLYQYWPTRQELASCWICIVVPSIVRPRAFLRPNLGGYEAIQLGWHVPEPKRWAWNRQLTWHTRSNAGPARPSCLSRRATAAGNRIFPRTGGVSDRREQVASRPKTGSRWYFAAVAYPDRGRQGLVPLFPALLAQAGFYGSQLGVAGYRKG